LGLSKARLVLGTLYRKEAGQAKPAPPANRTFGTALYIITL
jgi:hypothetical protein